MPISLSSPTLPTATTKGNYLSILRTALSQMSSSFPSSYRMTHLVVNQLSANSQGFSQKELNAMFPDLIVILEPTIDSPLDIITIYSDTPQGRVMSVFRIKELLDKP
jgi:hypothetical protein